MPGDAFCTSCGARVAGETEPERPAASLPPRSSGEPRSAELHESVGNGAQWVRQNPARVALGCGGLAFFVLLLGGCATAIAFLGGGFSGGLGGGLGGNSSDERGYISDVRSGAPSLYESPDSEIVEYGRETCDLFDTYGDAQSVYDELYGGTPGPYGRYEVDTVMRHGVEHFCPEHSGDMSDMSGY